MPFWFLNKKTNTAKIYGGVSAILQHEKLRSKFPTRKPSFKTTFTETFSRQKLDVFENENFRIERHSIITTKTKSDEN